MKDLTIIVPIINIDEELLFKALNSITLKKAVKILLVYPESIDSEVKKLTLPKLNIDLVANTGGTLFSEQVNFAVQQVKTKYFSILEFDDEYSKIYFTNAEKFIKENDVSVYLPIIVETKNGQFVKLTNEFVWSKIFIENDDFGFITNKQLMEFSYFYISGAIINTEDFKEVGMFKSKFDVTCVYEFLLRATFKGKKIYVIPKIGYLHSTDREGSATNTFSAKYSKKEIEDQYVLAKKEHMFN
jgi:GT2 family glycosyltransferase